MAEKLPVGYRFHPTDEELVGHYLKNKLLGNDSLVLNTVAEVDVCKFEPWDLPAFSKVESEDHEWFFFSPFCLKFSKGNKCNRKTESGYWKATGKDRNVKIRGTDEVIGTKKTLVFYKGRSPSRVKTNWVIHEYHAVTFPDDKRTFVLCRLIQKAEKKAEKKTDTLTHDEREPSHHNSVDCKSQATTNIIPNVNASPKVDLESFFQTLPQVEDYDSFSSRWSPIAFDIDQALNFLESSIPIDDMLHINFPDQDIPINEETTPAFVDDAIPLQSLNHHESSETDAEPPSLH